MSDWAKVSIALGVMRVGEAERDECDRAEK